MRKFIVRIICCFVPSRNARHMIRDKFCHNSSKTNSGAIYKNNKIVIVAPDGSQRIVKYVPGCDIIFKSDNNYIELHEPLNNLHLRVIAVGNLHLVIKPVCDWGAHIVIEQSKVMVGNNVYIGRGFSSTGPVKFELAGDDGDVYIGDDCMFSWGIIVRTGDFHTIIERGTNNIINHNKSVYIGNHVWLGSAVYISKGAHISDNSVVGAHSLVSRHFTESNVVIAGVPASIIKRDIDWDRRYICDYIQAQEK